MIKRQRRKQLQKAFSLLKRAAKRFGFNISRNRRFYSYEAMKNALEDYNKTIRGNTPKFKGECDHPKNITCTMMVSEVGPQTVITKECRVV